MADYKASITSSVIGDTTFIIPVSSALSFIGTLTFPTLSEGSAANAQVVTTLLQNGVARYTSNPGDEGFSVKCICSPGDVMILRMASSVVKGLNTVKCTLAVG